MASILQGLSNKTPLFTFAIGASVMSCGILMYGFIKYYTYRNIPLSNLNLHIAHTKQILNSGEVPQTFSSEEIQTAIASLPKSLRRFVLKSQVFTDIMNDMHNTICYTPPSAVFYTGNCQMKLDLDAKDWQDTDSYQIGFIQSPGFVWKGKIPLSFLFVQALDMFIVNTGTLLVKLCNILTIACVSTPRSSKDELLRYMAELPWMPDAIVMNQVLQPYLQNTPIPTMVRLKFHEINEVACQVSCVSPPELQGSLIFQYLNATQPSSEAMAMKCQERGYTNGDITELKPWVGLFWEFININGRCVPSKGQVGWEFNDDTTGKVIVKPYFRLELQRYQCLDHDISADKMLRLMKF